MTVDELIEELKEYKEMSRIIDVSVRLGNNTIVNITDVRLPDRENGNVIIDVEL